jgi:uncharacterized protein YqgC (DUF456 family)
MPPSESLIHAAFVASVLLCAWVGVLLTLLLLPGMWIALAGALTVQLLAKEPLFSWWTLGVGIAIAAAGEALETASSAAGAKTFGASRSGMVGALVGTLLGAIVGTFVLAFLPIIGTLLGAVVGAALGALFAERGVAGRSWRESTSSGVGAAAGRVAGVGIKFSLAIILALLLSVAAFVP